VAAPSWASAEGSQPLAGMTMPLGGVKVVSLVVFCHAMNALEGPENRRDLRERSKPSGVPLQPLQGSALSVGLDVFLQRPVLATTFKPAHDQGRSRGLRLEMYAVVCGSFACRIAVKSTVVAIAQCAPRAS